MHSHVSGTGEAFEEESDTIMFQNSHLEKNIPRPWACWRIRAGILENVGPGVGESKTVSRDRGNEQLDRQPTRV